MDGTGGPGGYKLVRGCALCVDGLSGCASVSAYSDVK